MDKRAIVGTLIGLGVLCGNGLYAQDKAAAPPPAPAAVVVTKQAPVVPTIAIMPFECRLTGSAAEGMGSSVADLLTSQMSETGEFELADRGEINKIMGELKLNSSGLVTKETQLKIGKLIGAKIIITGSIFKNGDKNYIVAKIIGVETSRVIGVSASGVGAALEMVPELKTRIAEKIMTDTAKLLPPVLERPGVLEELKKEIGDVSGRSVYVKISERTLLNVDPAAETEFKKLLLALGFKVVESPDQADFRITGEGLAENSGQFKEFFSSTARIEIHLHAKDNRLIASDRQVETVAGPAINIASKDALAQTALILARRIIPQIK